MPVTPTYPGIYIEELPSSARTITAAPTSITVFVGYTHPFKTNKFREAIRIFNFTEYEREFGGFFVSGQIVPYVPLAVNQFFLNGGSDAYVVGLEPHYGEMPSTTIGNIKFEGLEPVDLVPMKITVSNLQKTQSDDDTADITIIYGSQEDAYRVETFRKVTLSTVDEDKVNYLPNRINGISTLVKVLDESASTPPDFGSAFTPNEQFLTNISSGDVFEKADFLSEFQADSSLDKVQILNLLLIPGISDNSILSAALDFCERKQAFLILDPPEKAVADRTGVPVGENADDFLMEKLMLNSSEIPKSTNGALYFPYLNSTDPLTGRSIKLPPSGFVAGIYARTDLTRGVWKAPAGLETTIQNTTGVVEKGRMTDQRQGTLNPIGVNCLRSFPGIGTVVYGARTLMSNNKAHEQWKYVPVRRMALFIEQTLYRNLGWVVFEPNDEPLWVAIRISIENFMLSLFNQGAFQGAKPSQAFQVKCDSSTTTQTDIDNGVVNIIVAFAPLKPAEFVIVKIAQLAGQVQS
jgi:phage tail sheath protein FI